VKFENRAPAEGINSSPENPLIELGWLLAGSLGVIIALVIVTSLAAQWIAPRIPYRYEAKLAATLPPFATAPDNEAGRRVQAELQELADLPSIEVLRSKLLGLLQAPATTLVRLLNTPGGQLARVLQAHVDKQGGEPKAA